MILSSHSLILAEKERVSVDYGNPYRYQQTAFVTAASCCLVLGYCQPDTEALHCEENEKAATVHGKPNN
jgi:hypothetical protein